MEDDLDNSRRKFLGVSLLGLAAIQLNEMCAAKPTVMPSTAFAPLKRIRAGLLNVSYAEAGPTNGTPVLLLHGWPYDIYSFVEVAPRLAAAGYRVLMPYLRGYGDTRFASDETMRNAQPAAVATDAIEFLNALQIKAAVIAGFDWGGRTANLMAFLWPDRCRALVSVSGYLVGSQESAQIPLPPVAELQWWYQFYFSTDRGKAGYEKHTKDFNRLIWKLASPKWAFDDATFERSAAAFQNPDFVAISLHNYRWRFSLEPGEPKYDELERKIATFPTISIPTITLEGDANGAPHAEPTTYAKKYTGHYEHRNISGGIGHNLPQEAPADFAQAIMDVERS